MYESLQCKMCHLFDEINDDWRWFHECLNQLHNEWIADKIEYDINCSEILIWFNLLIISMQSLMNRPDCINSRLPNSFSILWSYLDVMKPQHSTDSICFIEALHVIKLFEFSYENEEEYTNPKYSIVKVASNFKQGFRLWAFWGSFCPYSRRTEGDLQTSDNAQRELFRLEKKVHSFSCFSSPSTLPSMNNSDNATE